MSGKAQLWPEGRVFTREVVIQTGHGPSEEGAVPAGYEDFPVMMTFIVPPFDVVVETWRNADPAKSYALFRQFIVGWDQEDVLSDKVLMGFLCAYPGSDEAIFTVFCEHIKAVMQEKNRKYPVQSQAIN
ncbi:hypothetical protein RIU82_03735 [Enterobacter soli]|nr:hypothetical protein [Enterobacter soli]